MSSSSSSRRGSASRSLSLHPSALSDAEHTLFTASLVDLTDADVDAGTIDWEGTTLSVREARAWLCGRYPELGAGTVDEILRLFAPATTLSAGAFAAALRLVLHARAGAGIHRSLAFVQAPVPVSIASIPRVNTTNPFLPTPAPSPEALTRPLQLLPSRPSSDTSSSITTSSSSSSSAHSRASPMRKSSGHAYSASLSALAVANPGSGSTPALSPALPSPPVHPLRRAATQTQPQTRTPSIPKDTQTQPSPSPSNPFNRFRPPPPLPPRRASTSTYPSVPVLSPFDVGSSPSAPRWKDINTGTGSGSGNRNPPPLMPRTAPPTRSTFSSAFDVSVQPPTPSSASASAFYPSSSSHSSHSHSRRVVSDGSTPSPSPLSPSFPPPPAFPASSPAREMQMPMGRTLRRTLAGAGWVGAERGEREGLLDG
ncbi:hypothetical protein C8F01DRAFT_1126489 [Mycena amicta]|nr:hypothetical protein C8F01DRAFT_1126489 [Mycena amicta]